MLRVCSVIERVRVPISDEAFQESDAEKEARIERVNGNGLKLWFSWHSQNHLLTGFTIHHALESCVDE